jgi:Fur family ferric uptake transcriptional regulator
VLEVKKSGSHERLKMSLNTEAGTVAKIRKLLSDCGLRTTAARLALMHWLQRANSPATHAEISIDLVPLGIDKATVLRNLTDLVEAGLVTRKELGDHVWRFELRDATHPDGCQHAHFICVDCGRVTCLHKFDFPKSALTSVTEVGNVTEILIRGHCSLCQ